MANTSVDEKPTSEEEKSTMTISFVAAMFDDVGTAKLAYKALKEVQREGIAKILDAAYVEKTERSKIKVHERGDWRGGQGVLAGGAVGALIGIIGGAILLPAGIGALIGGIWAKMHDTGFDDKNLGKLADALPVGSSALIAIVEDDYVEQVEDEMKKEGGKKVHSGTVPKSTTEALNDSNGATSNGNTK